MKRIKINEEQFKMIMSLMETEAAPDFEDGDVKEYNDSSDYKRIHE